MPSPTTTPSRRTATTVDQPRPPGHYRHTVRSHDDFVAAVNRLNKEWPFIDLSTGIVAIQAKHGLSDSEADLLRRILTKLSVLLNV